MNKEEGRQKYIRYLIAGGLAVILIVSPLFGFSANLSDKAQKLKSQKETYQEKAQEAEEEAQTLSDKIAMMDEQIEQINEEIKEVEKELKKTKKRIKELKTEIELKEEELAKEREVLKESVKYIYEEGDQPIVSVLFSSNSFSEALDRTEYLTFAEDKISTTIDNIEEIRDQMREEREELKEKKENVKELSLQLEVSKDQIKEEKEEKRDLLDKTKGDEKRYEKLVQAKERERQKVLQKIQNLESSQAGKHYDGKPTDEYKYDEPDKGKKDKEDKKKEDEDEKDKEEDKQKEKKPQAVWPLKNFKLTQEYGCTNFASCGDATGPYNGKPHNGIDLSSQPNNKDFYDLRVRSVMEGKVIMVSPEEISGGWGNAVVVAHPNGLFSLYGHLSRAIVKEGQKVKKGQLIGFEGNTGFSTGRHLHFSIYMKITIYKTDWYYGPGYDFAYTLDPVNILPKL